MVSKPRISRALALAAPLGQCLGWHSQALPNLWPREPVILRSRHCGPFGISSVRPYFSRVPVDTRHTFAIPAITRYSDGMSKEWAEGHASRVAAAVKELRGKRSGQWLSDRTAELGYRVSRTTISELENNKRKYVTTAELCVLAIALEVPPLYLLYPDQPDGSVEVAPGVETSSIVAATWFSGENINPSSEEWEEVFGSNEPPAPRLLSLSRKRFQLADELKGKVETIGDLRGPEHANARRNFTAEVTLIREQIKEVDRQIRTIEGAVIDDGG